MRKGAAHGFRNLSVIKIPFGFEQAITEMKIKSDEIVNSFSSCRNISLFFAPIPSANGAAREIPRRPRLVGEPLTKSARADSERFFTR